MMTVTGIGLNPLQKMISETRRRPKTDICNGLLVKACYKILSCVTGIMYVPVTKALCGPRETVIWGYRLLLVVTDVVECPLQICVFSNGCLPVNFVQSFVTLNR